MEEVLAVAAVPAGKAGVVEAVSTVAIHTQVIARQAGAEIPAAIAPVPAMVDPAVMEQEV